MSLNHILAPIDRLYEELSEKTEHRAETYLSAARKEQLSHEIGYILFEIQEREATVLLEAM